MTIEQLLEELDGAGLIIEDPEAVENELHRLGLAPFDPIPTTSACRRLIATEEA